MKFSSKAVAAVAAVTVLLGGFAVQGAGADGEVQVLNPSGGVTGTDGMRITFGAAQLQVQRKEFAEEPECSGEIYGSCSVPSSSSLYSQIALAVGDSTNGGTAFLAPALVENTYFDAGLEDPSTLEQLIVKRAWNAETTISGDSIVSTLTGEADGLTYTVVVTLSYTSPDDRMTLEYEVIIPDGNTKPVRLYHLMDTYLGGRDAGPGFFTEPVTCGAGESGAIVGVDRADLGVVEAFQYIGGTPWTSYMSAYYNDVVFGDNTLTDVASNEDGEYESGPHFGPGFMNDLNNQIITDPNNDNGIGISWNFGTKPGTRTSTAKLIFSSATIDPCADPDAVSVTNPDPTEVPDPIIDPDVTEPPIDPLKDETPSEVVAPTFTG